MVVASTVQQYGNLDVQGSMLANYLMECAKQGLTEQTILSHSKILRLLSRHIPDLRDVEAVRQFIADSHCSRGRKQNLVDCYSRFSKFNGISYSPDQYGREETLPFIPLEGELRDIVNGARSIRHGTALKLLFETAIRCGELSMLRYEDFDFLKQTVRVRPEKHSSPRELKISPELVASLKEVYGLHPERPFPDPKSLRSHLRRTVKNLAKIHSNPRYLQVHLHTFRHFRATYLYSQTKDILFVKHILGHKSIQNTIKYTQLVNWGDTEEFACKAVSTPAEASELIEHGFQYQCTVNEVALFRKRK